jgi:hypothetical protein
VRVLGGFAINYCLQLSRNNRTTNQSINCFAMQQS